MVVLRARYDAITFLLTSFEPILGGAVLGSFGGFGATGSEIHASLIPHSARRKSKKATGKFLGWFRMELRGMSVGDPSSLFGHGAPNLGNAVANRHDCSSTGGIEVTLASCGEDKTSFAAYGLRIRLQEISRKDGVITHRSFSIGMALERFCTTEPATISTIGRSASKGYSTVRRAERIHNRG